jgi:hypothetical protein
MIRIDQIHLIASGQSNSFYICLQAQVLKQFHRTRAYFGASYSCRKPIIDSALIKDTGDVLRISVTIGLVTPDTNVGTASQVRLEI